MREREPIPSTVHGWLPLTALAGSDPARIGGKAATLATALARGLTVPPGWVLPIDATSALEARPTEPVAPSSDLQHPASIDGDGAAWSAALQHARALLALAPHVSRWILRSSSPLEDRPGESAAGQFRSEPAAAVPEPLATALLSVIRSGSDALVGAAPPRDAGVPVAVLAQPLLELSAWWTLELRPADHVALLDGWRMEHEAAQSVTLQFPWPLPAHAGDITEPLRAGASPAVWSLAVHVLDTFGAGSWQLEVGERGVEAVLLQVRAAPARWSALPDAATTDDLPGSAREEFPGFPIHPADRRDTWRWDAEHCPTPLCPLLAGWFGRWLRALPASHPSRLIDGRWHDRVESGGSALSSARPTPWPVPHAVVNALAAWHLERQPRLTAELAGLAHDADALATAPQGWPAFMERWLAFQRAYFDAPEAARSRAWARSVAQALAGRTPPPPFPALPETEAAERERDLQRLAELLRAGFPGAGAWRSAEQLERALAHSDTLATRAAAAAVRAHQSRYGYVAEAPWDGRGVCLEEDVRPLLRELVRRSAPHPTGPPVRSRAPQLAPEALDAAWAASIFAPDERAQAREAALFAARVLAWAEDDDVVLVRSYALFRRAARAVARCIGPGGLAEREVFELMPADLEVQLRQADLPGWKRAVRRGRALAARWAARLPYGMTAQDDANAPGVRGAQRRGLAAAPGRAAGTVRRLEAAQQDGGPLPGEVLVVRTLLPHDAVVLGRVAAVVVESGTPLCHAAVLAREQGVPAVMAVPGALRWLAAAERVLVDGDLGTVTILSVASHDAPSA